MVFIQTFLGKIESNPNPAPNCGWMRYR